MTANPSVLTTDRLILTPVDESDFDDLCALWADENFTRHIIGRTLSAEEVWSRVLRDIGHWKALGYGNWSIRSRDDASHVGTVGILNFKRDLTPPFDAPELGWGLSPRFQGRGLAQEALVAALDWSDRVLRAPRTACMISPENGPSIRLAERNGYAPYAEAPYHGATVTLFERVAAA